jgi:hypothetical protein
VNYKAEIKAAPVIPPSKPKQVPGLVIAKGVAASQSVWKNEPKAVAEIPTVDEDYGGFW